MSFQIDTARIVQFGANILMLSQQKGSRFRNASLVEPGIRGKKFSRDQVGATNARKRSGRHQDTPMMETPHYRRWLTTSTYDWADLVDNVDKLKVIEDPTNAYAMAAAAAMGRAMDDEWITAFFGTAVTGEEGGTSTSFDSNNVVAVNSWAYGTGTGNVGLTVSKLIEARRMLKAAETGIDESEAYIAVSAKQEANLLATEEATSSEYGKPTLVDGRIQKFLGFNFIHSERLPTDTNSYRRCPVWLKRGMCLGIVEDVISRISERADKNYATQVYAEMDVGATRMEEACCVEIKCAE